MRRYLPEDDTEIGSWYNKRGLIPAIGRYLPKIGMIEPGVAAGFLYQTDSTIAWLESFVTNPEASSSERNVALDRITSALIHEAKKLGFTILMVYSRVPSITDRAREFGFCGNAGYTLLSRTI